MLFKNRTKLLQQIRSDWGKPIDRFRNFDLISLLHKNLKVESPVDEKTATDLNLEDLFEVLDRNTSPLGQQYLYHLLNHYEEDEEILKQRIEEFQFYKNNSELREKLQLEFKRLDETNSYFIAPLIFGELPERPKFYPLFFILNYLAIIASTFVFYDGRFLFLVFAVFLINLIINKIFSDKIHTYFAGFSSLNNFLILCRKIISNVENENEDITFIKYHKSLIKKINKKIGSLILDKAAMNDMMVGIVDYLNIYFLYDLRKYSKSVGLLQQNLEIIKELFIKVAKIDSSISIASYIEFQENICQPEFIEERKITLENLSHPLIVNAVSNSLIKLEKSLLVTGSNMAGKTTFIKTIGINFIMAQTLGFCAAQKAVIPRLIVKSAIRRNDDLENSKSYFFVEIEELQEFIKLADVNSNYLFLIDEIFRGTNTIERLAASTAVLEDLSHNNFVFVTTHDIELQELLATKFRMIHFSEQVDGNNFYFDYKLQDGPTSSGNALKLLEIKGYKISIVKKARELSKSIIDSKKSE